MEQPLWAPWRIEYILGEREEGCLFCRVAAEEDDRANLILYRGRLNYVIMNLYPYAPGHLMVAPYVHLSDLDDLDGETAVEMMALTRAAVSILRSHMRPQGFNVGLNLGEAGGASIREHLHQHIVPRWTGDNNFMPVLADTRVVPQSLADTYALLRPDFEVIKP